MDTIPHINTITLYNIVQTISVCGHYISSHVCATCIQCNAAILFISRLLACKYHFTLNLSRAYQTLRRKNGVQYRSKCNIVNSFRNDILFSYV